ncbi:hypothetical protein M011DRAFT_477678 [Sporormia fimetaria CBS 119925]|uniref:Uncharacterized protein n=1 Tax=Sporormia fimetaria CBS 119925 TaxID=1340428 RepID=A0A6A6VC80_9PLEO|nr:hypothetical protein M011DRAFT_477678 [Sporormia fimetaria CBS 119925]
MPLRDSPYDLITGSRYAILSLPSIPAPSGSPTSSNLLESEYQPNNPLGNYHPWNQRLEMWGEEYPYLSPRLVQHLSTPPTTSTRRDVVETSPLLRLPREIRDMIYVYALTCEEGLVVCAASVSTTSSSSPSASPADSSNHSKGKEKLLEEAERTPSTEDKSSPHTRRFHLCAPDAVSTASEFNQLRYTCYQLYLETQSLTLPLNTLTFHPTLSFHPHLTPVTDPLPGLLEYLGSSIPLACLFLASVPFPLRTRISSIVIHADIPVSIKDWVPGTYTALAKILRPEHPLHCFCVSAPNATVTLHFTNMTIVNPSPWVFRQAIGLEFLLHGTPRERVGCCAEEYMLRSERKNLRRRIGRREGDRVRPENLRVFPAEEAVDEERWFKRIKDGFEKGSCIRGPGEEKYREWVEVVKGWYDEGW